MTVGNFQNDRPSLYNQGLFEESSTAKHPIGTRRPLEDGRVFVYAKAGSGALSAGKLCVAPTIVANHVNQSIGAAAAVGDKTVYVDLGATAMTKNQYAEGYLIINDAAGEGHLYKIRANDAGDASASSVKVELYDAIRDALTTSSEYTLMKHPYDSVVVSATDQADTPVGVPPIDVTAGHYFWIQTWGCHPLLADETLAIGKALTIGSSTAGSAEVVDAVAEPLVGYAIQAGVDTEYRMVFLTIQP